MVVRPLGTSAQTIWRPWTRRWKHASVRRSSPHVSDPEDDAQRLSRRAHVIESASRRCAVHADSALGDSCARFRGRSPPGTRRPCSITSSSRRRSAASLGSARSSRRPAAALDVPTPVRRAARPVHGSPRRGCQTRRRRARFFVELGELCATTGPRSTRMVTEERAPSCASSDSLRCWYVKQGVSEHVDELTTKPLHVASRSRDGLHERSPLRARCAGRPAGRALRGARTVFLDRGQNSVAMAVLQRHCRRRPRRRAARLVFICSSTA